MPALQSATPATKLDRPSGAVIWINGREAIVARTTGSGLESVVEIRRETGPETTYLAHVVSAIGDRERVLIMGPSSTRLDLEREYVTLYRRPDRLVDVEPAGPVSTGDVLERLHALIV